MKERRKVKVYISGPITGVENWRDNFEKAEQLLAEKGYEVLSPRDIGEELDDIFSAYYHRKPTYEDYMERDLEELRRADFIYALKGWTRSKGCLAEMQEAMRLLIPRIEDSDL